MKKLTIILPRRSTPWAQLFLLLVQEQQIPDAEEILYDIASHAGVQITQIATSLTLTGKLQLEAQLIGNVDSVAIVRAGGTVYQQRKIDYLLYRDDKEQPEKIALHGHWTRTWL
jgi:hypothetical protein